MAKISRKKLPKKVIKEVEDFIGILESEKVPIDSMYIFGSYAKGKQRKWSDIDVCVISPRFGNAWKAMLYLWEKRPKDCGLTIEPVGYSPKDFAEDPSPFVYEIKKYGIRVR